MRKAISVIFFCLFCLSQAPPALPQKPISHGGKIETTYNGFALETVMRLRKMKVNCTGFKSKFDESCVSIDVVLHCPGTQVSNVSDVTLQLIFESKNWGQSHAPYQRDLLVAVDSETWKLGRMRLVPQVTTETQDRATETLQATLSYKMFKRMVAAQSVAIKVGPSAMTLSEKNLMALRDLDNRVVK